MSVDACYGISRLLLLPDTMRIMFGDGNEIALCDLRKPIKREFTQHRMTVSAETILVGENEVIVAGRGGDLCLLKNGGS